MFPLPLLLYAENVHVQFVQHIFVSDSSFNSVVCRYVYALPDKDRGI
jgi:hypothetical protein